jgi:hypothetical protein
VDIDGLQYGGEGGIRTPGTLTRTLVFKTSAFNHSATSPTAIEHRDFLCIWKVGDDGFFVRAGW